MASRELIVRILGDASSLERAFARASTAGKSFTRTVALSDAEIQGSAQKNVAALAVQRRELQLLSASYAKMGAAAVAGSNEAIAAATLQRQAQARLALTGTSVNARLLAGAGALAKSYGVVGGVVGAAALTIGSIGAKAKFEDTLQRVVGLSGVAQDRIEGFRKSILDLAGNVGKGPQELAEALYFVTSSGVDASHAMEVLEVSAKAAAAGLGDTQVVADAVTSVMNAYGANVVSAARATDVLVATVREGKGEAADFAGSIGNVVAFASRIGVSFEDVGGALAAMTQLGTDAETASIQLQQFFSALLTTSPKAVKAFAAVGLTTAELRRELKDKGLLATLETLRTAFAGNVLAAREAFENIRGFRAVLALTGGDAQKTAGVFERLGQSSGSLATAFGAVKDDDLQRFRQLNATLKATEIELGSALAPAVLALVTPLRKVLQAVNGLEQALGHLAEIKIPPIHIPIIGDFKIPGTGSTLGHDISKAGGIAADVTKELLKSRFIPFSGQIGAIQQGIKLFADKSTKELTDAQEKAVAAAVAEFGKIPSGGDTFAERLRAAGFVGSDGSGTTAKPKKGVTATQRNQFFDAAIGRKEDLVQDIPTVQAQISTLQTIAGLIQARLAKTKDVTRRLKLEDDLRSVFREIKDDRAQLVQEATDALQFNVSKAEAAVAATTDENAFAGLFAMDSKSLSAAVAKELHDLDLLEQNLRARIRKEGSTAELEQQLFDAQQKRLTVQKQQKQALRQAVESARGQLTPLFQGPLLTGPAGQFIQNAQQQFGARITPPTSLLLGDISAGNKENAQFIRALAALEKRGFNKNALAQLAQGGIGNLGIAKSLSTAGRGDFNAINRGLALSDRQARELAKLEVTSKSVTITATTVTVTGGSRDTGGGHNAAGDRFTTRASGRK